MSGPLAGAKTVAETRQVERVYSVLARVYDSAFEWALRPGRRAAVEALDIRPGGRVLEVGVGTGLSLEMRRAGRVVGTAEVEYVEGTRDPQRARVVFPASASILAFTVEAIETIEAVDPDIWRRP